MSDATEFRAALITAATGLLAEGASDEEIVDLIVEATADRGALLLTERARELNLNADDWGDDIMSTVAADTLDLAAAALRADVPVSTDTDDARILAAINRLERQQPAATSSIAYDRAYDAAWDAFMRDGVSVLNAADQAHTAALTAVEHSVRVDAAQASARAADKCLRGTPLILDGNAGFIADNVEAFIIAEAGKVSVDNQTRCLTGQDEIPEDQDCCDVECAEFG